jgi:hypothetical protein
MEKTEYKGYTIKIEQDELIRSPREDFENMAKMVCFHSRYNLGDKHDYKVSDFENWNDMKKKFIKLNNIAVILPLYLYDHTGITMNTTGFSCQWDSGQVGWIYVSKETVRKEYGKCTKKNLERAEKYLLGEVETYDQYLTGDVYGYIVEDDNGNEVDSCWGMYGEKYAMEEAKSIVDHMVKKELVLEVGGQK